MSTETDTQGCCAEFARAAGLSRRRFLAGMAATSGAAVTASVFGDAFRQASFGQGVGNNVMVVISLRGGVDGMGIVVPHGDPAYYAARPTIGIPAASLVAADAMFGLHPAMQPLEWLWQAGELAAVHAVGMEVPNRSHFRAMEEIEDADPTSSVRRGWVNRMVGLGGGTQPYDAVGLGDPITPTALVGPALSLTAESLQDVSLAGADGDFLNDGGASCARRGSTRRARSATPPGPRCGRPTTCGRWWRRPTGRASPTRGPTPPRAWRPR